MYSQYWYMQQATWWQNNRGYYHRYRNRKRLDLVTPGTNSPVTLEEMKTHLIIEDTTWDDYCTDLIMSATDFCERYTGRSVFGSTWDQFQEKFHRTNSLYYPKLNSVDFVKYFDTTGTVQTLDPSKYFVQGFSEGMGIVRFDQNNWPPIVQHDNEVGVQIRFSTIPSTNPAFQHAIKLIAGEWFMQRANVAELQLWPGSMGVSKLLDPLKVGGYV